MTPTIPILLYHHVDESGDAFSTPPATFERELAWLANRGYRSLTLAEFDRAVAGTSHAPPARAVLITFDDGYADLSKTVAPALRRHGFTGVAFVITGLCGRTGPAGEVTGASGNHVSWSEARALATDGVLEFQSHSHSHERWSNEAGADGALAANLAASVDVLADELRLPRSYFRHLAWPWGRCTESWEHIARDLGLTHQHIVQRGAVTRVGQSTRLPRICFDGASAQSFRRWVTVLSSPVGARACNRIFGTIRARKHGLGYV
jgi:peptidoglycan/xylan/chitin deacetylase (PgdA/CDA1 family)